MKRVRSTTILLAIAAILNQTSITSVFADEGDEGIRSIALSGTVLDQNQSPIGNATVFAHEVGFNARRPSVFTTKTDDQGSFRLTVSAGADATRVKVMAFKRDHAIAAQFLDFKESDALVTSLELWPGANLTLDVVDESGQPVENAVVHSIGGIDPKGNRFWIVQDVWKQLGLAIPSTDAAGKLSIPNQFASVPVRIVVRHPEYAYGQVKSLSPEDERYRLTLERGREVKFRVSCEAIPDAVTDATVSVRVTTELGHYIKEIPIDKNGNATTRLADRMSNINVEHPTLFGHPWHVYRPQPDQVFDLGLYRTGTVRGRVVSKGTETEAAEVFIQAAADQRVISSARTDEEGNFELEVPEFEIEVSVNQTQRGDWKSESEEQTVTVAAGKSITLDDFVVTRKTPTKGRVLLASGEPVKNAIVLNGFRDALPLTNDQGQFEVTLSRFGTAFVQVLHPTEKLSAVASIDPEEKKLDIVLEKEGYTYGIVVGPDGERLSGFPVGLNASVRSGTGRGSTVLRRTRTRDDGTFRFLGLTDGMRYQVEVRGKHRASYSHTKVSHGDYLTADQQVDRDPIQVRQDVFDEIQQLGLANRIPVKRLIPPKGEHWFNSNPLSSGDYEGKSVLLCLVESPYSLQNCQVVHELYAEMGLMVVGVVRPSNRITPKELPDLIEKLGLSFPIVLGGGDLFAKSNMTSMMTYWLFDPQGNFHSEVPRNLLLDVRSYMLYEHLGD